MTRRASSRGLPYAALGLLLALVLLPLLALTPAYAARTITISITANGPQPATTTAAVGDTIVFKNDDATFVHQVANKSANWKFDTGPLAPGAQALAGKLTAAGDYVYQGVNLDSFTGKVTVPASTTTASPSPAATRSAAPAPSRSSTPTSASSVPTESASPTGGSGVVGPPPLAGGFGTVAVPGSPAPGAGAPAPNVAPTLPGEDVASPLPSGEAVAVGRGRLPEPPTGRRYGLPAALAAVASVGVASLLVRLLLAHPAARRAKQARRGDLQVTVD